jgi:hypothetical protein
MVDAEVMDEPEAAPSPPRRRRRRWLTLWIIAPVLFLILLAIARVIYWRTSIAYAPLRLLNAGTPAVGQPVNVTAAPTGFVISGPEGTQQVFEFQIENHGKHPVDISGIRPADDAVVQVQWAANFVEDGQRVLSPSHPLPVHVPRNAIVNIQLVVEKPSCAAGSVRHLSGQVTIHWHSMISPHATKLNLLKGHPQRIALCPAS